MEKKYVLIKDVIIKAGTVFSASPNRREYVAPHSECIIGLTDDTCGHFVYDIDFNEDDRLREFFAELSE